MVGLQVGVLSRQVPGYREEFVLAGEFFAEGHQGVAEVVLAGKDCHAWVEMGVPGK